MYRVIGYLLLLFVHVSVYAQQQVVQSGAEYYQNAGGYGCSACHGAFAQGGGNVGSNIRGKSLQSINDALENELSMQLLANSVTPSMREDIAAYLQSLGELQLVEWVIESEPKQQLLTIDADKTSQLVIQNRSFTTLTINLTGISEQSVVLEPYQTKAYQWQSQTGTLVLSDQQHRLTIQVK